MKIENDKLVVEVLPELGATLGQFALKYQGQVIDIFRKADFSKPTLKNISFFVMGPWIARIPERKFIWQGREAQIEHPADPEKAIHGIFRQFPWEVKEQNENSVAMKLNFKSGDRGYTFVSDFLATIKYQIDSSTLKVIISILNTGSEAMPCAFGSHPMVLKRSNNAKVKFNAKKWFPPDPDLLVPKGCAISIPASLNSPEFRDLPPDWDHCLADWQGEAIIAWPEEKLQLVMGKEDSNSNFLQCWSGKDREVFALEQQTGPANSFNLLHRNIEDNGVKILNSKEKYEVVHTYSVFKDE